MGTRITWVVTALAISALAYYAAAFGIGDLSSPARFKIILAMLFAQSVGLIVLGSAVYSLIADSRRYHRAAAQVAMLKGLWRSLDIAAEKGGLSLEARVAIYHEADEAFALYEEMMGREPRLSPLTRPES